MNFDISIQPKGENLEVVLKGDLDINSSPKMKTTVLDAYEEIGGDIIFSLEQLEYLDSTGLGAFISIYKHTKEKSHTICIQGAKANIKKLFTITELDRVFSVE